MTAGRFSLEYDPEADAMYVWLAPVGTTSARSEALDDGRIVDYDDNERPVGVEFLGVSKGVDLLSVPDAVAIAELLAKLPAIKAVV
jgi:uncharacterized protein YuzE